MNNNMVSKAQFKLECLLLILIYTNAKFLAICKTRFLNVKERITENEKKKKKKGFEAVSMLLFIGEIIIAL